MSYPHGMGRRAFLARIGVLGAAAGAAGILPQVAHAGPGDRGLKTVVDALRPVLDELARDTLNGLAVFVVPGPDPYSRAQGTPRAEPGAIEARAPDFLMNALDNFVPFPDQVARPLAAAFAAGLGDTPLPLPAGLLDISQEQVGQLDDALRTLLNNDEAIPLSLAVALLLDYLATSVNPAAVNGPFVSPFARLSFDEKAEAFRMLEGPQPDLVALLDQRVPQPLTGSVSGLLRFVGGALLEFSAFGAYSEFAVFDPRTDELTGRPVGWRLTDYLPNGPVEGWDDFQGYYQGRRKVEA